ncbi:hypothetical protein SDC9_196488 [bioreactor metagenome]|uniref:Uncharacterized protein n=1 Tax=bioreactor metagenome TaxID=1076179 RepID=A0A645ID88_9ZZZZ
MTFSGLETGLICYTHFKQEENIKNYLTNVSRIIDMTYSMGAI